jgi:hypothetical protein
MPENKDMNAVREQVLKIVASKGTFKAVEYTVREYPEPGSIPNWFMGVILLLKDEIQPDEKIVIHDGIISIAKKTAIDKLVEWVKGSKKAPDIDGKVSEEGLRH